jgi:hypothetical protein
MQTFVSTTTIELPFSDGGRIAVEVSTVGDASGTSRGFAEDLIERAEPTFDDTVGGLIITTGTAGATFGIAMTWKKT